MAWVYLITAGLMEIGWPLGLKLARTPDGVRAWPVMLAVASMTGSGLFLYLAQRTIPMGTAYAVWTGIGAVGTFAVGLAVFGEPANAARVACALLIVAGVIGFKVFS